MHLSRSEEHTSELQSRPHLVCRLLLEKYGDHPHLHSFPTRRSSDLSIELPSSIGNSDASTSIKQLSIPNAYKAAIPCSMVLTVTSFFPITVPRCVFTTLSANASIKIGRAHV